MWHQITVEQYQHISSINSEQMDDVDKILRIMGVLYNMTESQLNDLPVTRFHQMTAEVTAIFSEPLKEGKPKRTIKAGGKKYRLQYEVGRLRFAQYVEAQHFLKGGIIENLHMIAASIARPVKWFKVGKNESDKHEEVASDFLQANFSEVYNSVVFFCALFNKWNKGYRGLFGASDDEEEETTTDPFNDRYGWIFSATEIKEHEGITLDQVFNLPVIQAFNDLAYLKELKIYQKELNKKANAAVDFE